MTNQEKLERAKLQLKSAQNVLKRMSRYAGDRSFIENYEIPQLQKEIVEIEKNIEGNTVRVVEVIPQQEESQEIQQEESQITLQVVDTKEYDRRIQHITNMLGQYKNNPKLRNSYKTTDTCYKKFNRSYKKTLKIDDYTDRMEALWALEIEMFANRTLQANYEIVTNGLDMVKAEQRLSNYINRTQ